MSPSLHRLGRSCAAHPWRVLAAWALLVATMATLALTVGAPLRDDWDVPGAASQRGLDLLREHGVGGYASARVVVHDRDGTVLPPRSSASWPGGWPTSSTSAGSGGPGSAPTGTPPCSPCSTPSRSPTPT